MSKAALKVREEVLDEVSNVEELVIDTAGPLDELDAMFEELEAGMTTAVVTDSSEPSEDEMVQAGAAVELANIRAEAFAELDELSTPVNDESTLATGVAEPKKKAPVTKRISSVGVTKSEALGKALGAKLGDYLTLDIKDLHLPAADLPAKIDAKLNEIDSLPIKIQEKVVNFYAHLVNGASLSNYTKIAVDILVKDREISSKTLRDAYIARPYSMGTANSQCTQLMKLLVVLGLATKEAGKLVANPDSTLLPMFEA